LASEFCNRVPLMHNGELAEDAGLWWSAWLRETPLPDGTTKAIPVR
jgi:hypothetical protein